LAANPQISVILKRTNTPRFEIISNVRNGIPV